MSAILKGPDMAMKKATSAARKSARPRKAAQTRAVPTKASATSMTAASAKTKTSGAKVTTKSAAKTAKTSQAATKAGATKVTVAKTTPKTRATKVAVPKTVPKATPKTRATKVTAARPPVSKAVADKTASNASGGRRGGAGVSTRASAQPQRLRVRENEGPWTVKELATVHAELESDIARLRKEISVAEVDLAGLMSDIGDGAGDDPADAGTATFEREQEISLANNAREVFEQSARALARLVAGTYGVCESCGNPIGKNRLLAFPRATLCLTCKSKQERR